MRITRIQGFQRYIITENGTIYDTLKNKVINATWSKRSKEYQVRLYDENKKPRFKKVHRLLVENFQELNEREYVLFKDRDKRNVNLYNLTNARRRKINSLQANIEPIFDISAYQEMRDTLDEMSLSEVNKNINDNELEEVLNELLSHQQTRALIKNILISKGTTL